MLPPYSESKRDDSVYPYSYGLKIMAEDGKWLFKKPTRGLYRYTVKLTSDIFESTPFVDGAEQMIKL